MEKLFNHLIEVSGVPNSVLREDLKNNLDQSKAIYYQRITGVTPLAWSATTRCVKCGEWWMWGVKDNLNFVCDKCK